MPSLESGSNGLNSTSPGCGRSLGLVDPEVEILVLGRALYVRGWWAGRRRATARAPGVLAKPRRGPLRPAHDGSDRARLGSGVRVRSGRAWSRIRHERDCRGRARQASGDHRPIRRAGPCARRGCRQLAQRRDGFLHRRYGFRLGRRFRADDVGGRRPGVRRAIPPGGGRDHHGEQGDAILEDGLRFPGHSLEHDRLTGTWNARCCCRDGAATPRALRQVPSRRFQIVLLPAPCGECSDGASLQTIHAVSIRRPRQRSATICIPGVDSGGTRRSAVGCFRPWGLKSLPR
jgi:hypothetical protein